MNEDKVAEGCIPSEEILFGNNSKDSIPDAKYYLVRPKYSDIIFLMNKKPDYKEEPFYNSFKGCKLNMEDYLTIHCLDSFDIENMTEGHDYLCALGICPDENSVSYVFTDPTEDKVDISTVLSTTDNFTVDKEVANHYKIYDWHIAALLALEPFKTYIEKTYGSKTEEPKVVEESKNSETNLNKRLLI